MLIHTNRSTEWLSWENKMNQSYDFEVNLELSTFYLRNKIKCNKFMYLNFL